MNNKGTCFIVGPIGLEGSETRTRSDQLLRHVIAPAVENCGYDPVRADSISEPGVITTQVVNHILNDPLVVADLTDRNPNVFYELALRHAIRKPLVQVIIMGQEIPFDVSTTRTVQVDLHDLDSVQSAKAEIGRQVCAAESGGATPDNPISQAVDLQSLRESGRAEGRASPSLVNSVASLIDSVDELRTAFSRVFKKLDDPTELLPPAYLRQVIGAHDIQGIDPRALRDLYAIAGELEDLAARPSPENLRDGAEKPRRILGYLADRFRRVGFSDLDRKVTHRE